MQKRTWKFEIQMLVLLVFLSLNSSVYAQLHPLPLSILNEYKTELKVMGMEELNHLIYQERHFQKFDLLLEEVVSRKSNNVETVLEEFIETRSNDHFLGSQDFAASAILELKKYQSKSVKDFIIALDELLAQAIIHENKTLIRRISNELGAIENQQALGVLKKYEDSNSNHPIKINRLRIEMKGMSRTEILSYCINSARETILNSDLKEYPKLVAERSSISFRHENAKCINIIRNELSSRTWAGERNAREYNIYIQFLKFLAYRFTNPEKSTNPSINAEIEDLVIEIK